jgi:1-acyl-sn-glycerol-3-phosphate acyltransferase
LQKLFTAFVIVANFCIKYYYQLMSMPELKPENYEQIYEYFEEFEPSKRIQDIGFGLMHAAYGSEMHYQADSYGTISKHLGEGGSVILAPKHQSNADTPTIAGLVYEEPFKFMRGTTIIPAKASMFEWPLLGKFFPHMLAHPAFRSKDFADTNGGKELRAAVTSRLIDLNIGHLNQGGNNAIFVEGTRDKANPDQVKQIKSGIGRIAVGAKDPSSVLIVPVGIAYQTKRPKLRPIIVVEEPFSPKNMLQEDVTELTRYGLQKATSKAFRLAR